MGALRAASASVPSKPTASGASAPASPAVVAGPETPATPSPTPASAEGRDLSAIRQRLAQRNGGVNPPEAKVPDTALDRTTAETPDGGAEPLPNRQDSLKAAAKAAASTAAAPTPGAEGLSRGQKAAATRAANKAAKAAPTPGTVAVTAEPSAESTSAPCVVGNSELARIADALERIAAACEAAVELRP